MASSVRCITRVVSTLSSSLPTMASARSCAIVMPTTAAIRAVATSSATATRIWQPLSTLPSWQHRSMTTKSSSPTHPQSISGQAYASQSEVRPKPTAAATPRVGQVIGSNSVVITAAGPDRVGIVSELTQLLAEGNIEESRMTMLGNDFALILLVTLPAHISADKIQSILQKAFPEFIISARQTNTIPVLKDPTRILRIDLEGPDQPGIMAGLTQVFTDNGVSIRDLDTDTSSAPFAGYRIFSLKAWVAIPKSMTKEQLEEKLHIFETSNSVDLTVEDPIASTIESDSEEDDPRDNKKRKSSWK